MQTRNAEPLGCPQGKLMIGLVSSLVSLMLGGGIVLMETPVWECRCLGSVMVSAYLPTRNEVGATFPGTSPSSL